MSSQQICIAGKNNIAIEGMRYALSKFPLNNLFFICDINDSGEDGYFPSYKRFCRAQNVQEVSLNEAQSNEDLIFISLEYFKLIKPSLFKSKHLFNLHFSLLPGEVYFIYSVHSMQGILDLFDNF